jgi:hypothetical protein
MADMLNVINLPDLSPEEVNALDEAGLKIHFRQWVSFPYALIPLFINLRKTYLLFP